MSKPLIHELIERTGNLAANCENAEDNANNAYNQLSEAQGSLSQLRERLEWAENEVNEAYDYVESLTGELEGLKSEAFEIRQELKKFCKEDDVEEVAAEEGLEADIRRYKDRVMQHALSMDAEALAKHYSISTVLVRCIRNRYAKSAA